jgi:PKD repeat protein
LSITPATGYAPLTVTVDPTATTGTPTSVSLDMGDGNPNNSGVPYTWSSLPSAFSYTYASVGQYTATLTATNAVGTDTAFAVTNVQDSTNNGKTTQNLGLNLIQPGDSGRSLRNPYNANMVAIDTVVSSLYGVQVNDSPADIVLGGQVTGESYPRFVITTDGSYYLGDGTFDPMTATATVSYGGTPPSGTTTFASSSSANCGSSGSGTASVVLPGTIATGSYAVAAVEVHAATSISTPSGWTQVTGSPVDNSNGNDRLAVFYKAVSSTDQGGTLSWTLGTSTLWTCAVCVYASGTGVNVQAINANAGTAQTNHPSPSVTTTVANEVVIGIVAGRFSVSNGVISAPAGTNMREQDGSTSGTKDVGILMFDYIQAAAGATSVGNATTGQGMFSNAATVALTHP